MLPEPLRATNRVRFLGTVSMLVVSGLLVGACGSSGASDAPDRAAAGAGESGASTRSCGDLGYQQQTDNGAFGIKASGVTCATAREVAVRSRGFPPSYESQGFTCRNAGPQGELPSYPYTCTRGAARITFSAS